MIGILKDIKGFEGLYAISDSGEVWNYRLNRFITPKRAGAGYAMVTLYKNGKGKAFYIHRLVAEHFIDNPEKKETVNHKDGNKRNNHVDNLEWATRSENTRHGFKHGLLSRWTCRKLTKEQVIKIKELSEQRHTQKEIAKMLGVSKTLIGRVLTGRRYKEVTNITKDIGFKIGDTVTWQSQLYGNFAQKTGTIIAILEPNENLLKYIPTGIPDYFVKARPIVNRKRYLVAVKDNKSGKFYYYTPSTYNITIVQEGRKSA